MQELKPCPFCGSKKIHIYGMLHIVECHNCRASISAKPTTEKAIEAWNRRAETRPKMFWRDEEITE